MKIILYSGIFVAMIQFSLAQQINSVAPGLGMQGKETEVQIIGNNTHFQGNVTRADFGAGISIQKIVVINATTVNITMNIERTAIVGRRNVVITTGDEIVVMADGFEVIYPEGCRSNTEDRKSTRLNSSHVSE